MATLWERVEKLEEQIQRLLDSAGSPTAAHGSHATRTFADGDDDPYALNGLKQELPPPGGVVLAGSVELQPGRQIDWQYSQTTDALLAGDWTELSEPIAALGNPIRLRLLREIVAGTDSAAELSNLDDIGSTGQVYHHLRTLVSAGWLRAAARGRYEVPEDRVVPLLALLLAAQR